MSTSSWASVLDVLAQSGRRLDPGLDAPRQPAYRRPASGGDSYRETQADDERQEPRLGQQLAHPPGSSGRIHPTKRAILGRQIRDTHCMGTDSGVVNNPRDGDVPSVPASSRSPDRAPRTAPPTRPGAATGCEPMASLLRTPARSDRSPSMPLTFVLYSVRCEAAERAVEPRHADGLTQNWEEQV